MIYHRTGGLLEYALQSRSGDVFIDLFLDATGNDKDRVHTDALRAAYAQYVAVTNSSTLGNKALKTLIQERLDRHLEKDVKINQVNRSGYKGLKFDQDLFGGVIITLKNARTEGEPIFTALLNMFPDLKNSTNSTYYYHNSTTKTNISDLYGRIVEKVEGNKRDKEKRVKGNKDEIHSTTLLSLPFGENQTTDSENKGRVLAEKVVEEFMADGGQASLQRFLAEFPEAAEL
jgi:hypothetical protein